MSSSSPRGSRVQNMAFSPVVTYLEQVNKQGSIRKAAEVLHISPSSINRQIIKLEENLGVALFERLPRGLRPTSAGEELLGSLRRMAKEYVQALDNIESLKGLSRGHVAIAVPQHLAEAELGAVLFALHARHPGITYSVLVGTTDQIVAHLASGEADIGICLAPSAPAPVQAVASARLVLGAVMQPDHPLARHKSIKFSQCLAHKMVLPAAHMQTRKILDQVLWRLKARITPLIETDSSAFMRQAVLATDCIAFMTMADAGPDVSSGRLHFCTLSDKNLPASETAIFIKAGRSLPIAVQLVLEQLKSRFPFIPMAA